MDCEFCGEPIPCGNGCQRLTPREHAAVFAQWGAATLCLLLIVALAVHRCS